MSRRSYTGLVPSRPTALDRPGAENPAGERKIPDPKLFASPGAYGPRCASTRPSRPSAIVCRPPGVARGVLQVARGHYPVRRARCDIRRDNQQKDGLPPDVQQGNRTLCQQTGPVEGYDMAESDERSGHTSSAWQRVGSKPGWTG